MPLLSNAKACYVGTTPITKIMAGSVEVWPKGPPPPFRNLRMYFKAPSNPSIDISQGFFIAWEVPVRPSNCSLATAYEFRYTNMDQSYPDDTWQSWLFFGYWNCFSWMPMTGEFDNNLVTFLDKGGRKEYVKVQIRHTQDGVVTTSEEYQFSILPEDVANYPPLPSAAMNSPCPETCT